MLFDYQRACNCYGATPASAQEATSDYKFQPNRLVQTTWSSPRTNRLLLEAGVGDFDLAVERLLASGRLARHHPRHGRGPRHQLRVADHLSRLAEPHRPLLAAVLRHLRHRHAFVQGRDAERGAGHQRPIHHQRQRQLLVPQRRPDQHHPVLDTVSAEGSRQRFRHVSPRISGASAGSRSRWASATTGTTAGCRRRARPGDTYGWPGAPSRNEWLGERSYEKVTGVPSWKDINPRLGAAYDVFGNGRTAIKFAIGRYVAKTNVDVPACQQPDHDVGDHDEPRVDAT